MEELIETIGEGEFRQEVKFYLLGLTMEVIASDEQTAMQEILKLKDESIRNLKASGLLMDQIIDGGHELWKPWYGQRKTGKFARYKLLLKAKSESLLSEGLMSITDLFQNKRYSLSQEMKQPEFEDLKEKEQLAIKDAFEDARAKAQVIAEISNSKLGRLIHASELSKAKRNSGVYGDEDWMGDNSRFVRSAVVAGGAATDPADLPVEKANRTVWVRYKFQFEIISA